MWCEEEETVKVLRETQQAENFQTMSAMDTSDSLITKQKYEVSALSPPQLQLQSMCFSACHTVPSITQHKTTGRQARGRKEQVNKTEASKWPTGKCQTGAY